jgi:molecular chaperone HtpG
MKGGYVRILEEKRVKELSSRSIPSLLASHQAWHTEKTTEKEVTDTFTEEDFMMMTVQDQGKFIDEEEGRRKRKPRRSRKIATNGKHLKYEAHLDAQVFDEVGHHDEYVAFTSRSPTTGRNMPPSSTFSRKLSAHLRLPFFRPKRAPLTALSGGTKKKFNHIKPTSVVFSSWTPRRYHARMCFLSSCLRFRRSSPTFRVRLFQQNKILRVIKKNLGKKCIEMFTDLIETRMPTRSFQRVIQQELEARNPRRF